MGLRWSIENNKFRDPARKVILLFGDAPAHGKYKRECLDIAMRFHREAHGLISTVSCRQAKPLVDFANIAKAGGGESFLLNDHHKIMEELVVLMFGNDHRDDVLRFFDSTGSMGREIDTVKKTHRTHRSHAFGENPEDTHQPLHLP